MVIYLTQIDHLMRVVVLGLSVFTLVSATHLVSRAQVTPDSDVASATSTIEDGSLWQLRSRHFLFGMPEVLDARYSFKEPAGSRRLVGVSVLVREGFVVAHSDNYKVPLWVASRWTRNDFYRSEYARPFPRDYKQDPELPDYARATTRYEFAESGMQRGHLARHKDNAAWGLDNSDTGCFMSNIAPQHPSLNGGPWAKLEQLHREMVTKPEQLTNVAWIISGTVFERDPPQHVANGVGVPSHFYKIIAWEVRGELVLRAFLFPNADVDPEPLAYAVSVDHIEELTGFDFFPDLEYKIETRIEAAVADEF